MRKSLEKEYLAFSCAIYLPVLHFGNSQHTALTVLNEFRKQQCKATQRYFTFASTQWFIQNTGPWPGQRHGVWAFL